MALVCDTGPLFASMDRDDPDHEACASLLGGTREPIVVPAPVLVELEWLLTTRIDTTAFDPFLSDVEEGRVRIADLVPEDYARIRTISNQYSDLPLGFVDAGVIAILERLNEPKVASLDHRHLRIVRPRHVAYLTLLP